jgi:hypothetical protein
MAQMNVDLSAVIAAQFLEQLSEEERSELIKEAIAKVLDGPKILEIIKIEALAIAQEEVRLQIQGNTEIRSKLVSIINGAFKQLLQNEEDLKTRLAEGFVKSLVKDRY